MKEPKYDLNGFIEACRIDKDVVITNKAQETARDELKLSTKVEVLQYIISFNKESFEHLNTADSEQQPGEIIDSYSIKAKVPIYLAYHKTKKDKWVIKSCKRDKRYPPDLWFGEMLKSKLIS